MTGAKFRSIRSATVVAVSCFAVVVIVLTVRAATRINQPGVRYPETDPTAWALRDFRDAIYYPVAALLDGVSPYHVANYVNRYPVGQDFPLYSPLTLILHLPFAWLPYRVSQWVYFAWSIGLSLILSWVVLFVCRLPRSTALVFALAAAMLLSRPGQMNLLLGQTTIPLILFSLLAFHFAQSRPWLAGLLFALATLKPTYGVLLMAFAFAMGHRRAAIAGAIIAACITLPLIGWIVSIQGGFEESIRVLRDQGRMMYVNPGRDPSQSFSRIDLLSLGARLAQSAPPKQLEIVTTAIGVGLGCAVLWWVSRRRRPESSIGPVTVFAWLAMLLAVYHHAYDAMLLTPVLLIALAGQDEFWRNWEMRWRVIWCALIAVPLVNYVATNSIIDAWGIEGAAWIIVTSLNGAVIFAAAIWLAIAMLRDVRCSASLFSSSSAPPQENAAATSVTGSP